MDDIIYFITADYNGCTYWLKFAFVFFVMHFLVLLLSALSKGLPGQENLSAELFKRRIYDRDAEEIHDAANLDSINMVRFFYGLLWFFIGLKNINLAYKQGDDMGSLIGMATVVICLFYLYWQMSKKAKR